MMQRGEFAVDANEKEARRLRIGDFQGSGGKCLPQSFPGGCSAKCSKLVKAQIESFGFILLFTAD